MNIINNDKVWIQAIKIKLLYTVLLAFKHSVLALQNMYALYIRFT